MRLDVLYRGPLSSCNYGCGYCPFAKRRESAAALERDAAALERFGSWIAANDDVEFGLLFTPWGEALVRPWYRAALARLSRLVHVRRAVAQTNGHWPFDWLDGADLDRLALWITYHPSQTTRPRFLARCRALRARGVRFSVGMVAVPGFADEARRLRDELPADIYLWMNAYKDGGSGYTTEEAARFLSIDPLFSHDRRRHSSRGAECSAGLAAISVDGDGVIRRCHFVDEPIGSIHGPWRDALRRRPCPRATCSCFLGYARLQRLGLAEIFGEGLLERVPGGVAEVRTSDWRQA